MRKEKYFLFIIVFSILLRFIYVIFFLDNEKYYFEDSNHYYTAAVNMVERGEFGQDAERPDRPFVLEPGYSIFLAGIILIFGKSFLAIRLIQSIVLALSSIMIFSILKKLTSNTFALLGSIFYLFYPFYFGFSGLLLPESIYLPIMVLFVYFCFEYLNSGKFVHYCLSAFALGILFHIKVASISLLIPLLFLPLFRAGKINLPWIKKGIASVVIVLLVSIPWGIRNYKVLGKITIPRNYGNAGNRSELVLKTSNISNIGVFKLLGSNAYNLYSPFMTKFDTKNEFNKKGFQIISFLSVLPLLISTVVLPFFRRNKFLTLLYGLLILYSLPYILLFGQTRYRLPIDFAMIIFLTLLLEKMSKNMNFIKQPQSN